MSYFIKIKVVLARNYSRVVTVPAQITLNQVHDLIQVLFDWDNDHLWEFEDFEGRRFSPHDADDSGWADDNGLLPPEDFCLGDVLPKRGAKLKYTYDFGDNWQHEITRMADPKDRAVRCLKVADRDGQDEFADFDGADEHGEEFRTPTADELTRRMLALDLKPRPRKHGLANHLCDVCDNVARRVC